MSKGEKPGDCVRYGVQGSLRYLIVMSKLRSCILLLAMRRGVGGLVSAALRGSKDCRSASMGSDKFFQWF